jgi:polyhydroxybutyrate depolymerase
MYILALVLLAMLPAAEEKLGPGDHERLLVIGDMHRSYIVHVPPQYDPKHAIPVVLALHGAGTNGRHMAKFTDLDKKADESGFAVAYPNGTGAGGVMLVWNSGGARRTGQESQVDDVAYLGKVLDDLEGCLNVDRKRVYATGMSNGGMMSYRVASEMSDRIAAIAPVSGTIAIDNYHPRRPVPVIHFHGTDDKLVPFTGPQNDAEKAFFFKSVPDTIRILVGCNSCASEPQTTELPDKAHDDTRVTRKVYAANKGGAEVVLYVIDGGGHTWPGRQPPNRFIGRATEQISANDLIWQFFKKHPLP